MSPAPNPSTAGLRFDPRAARNPGDAGSLDVRRMQRARGDQAAGSGHGVHNDYDDPRPALPENLVSRRMCGRAYIYSPRVTSQEWTDKVACDVVAKLVAGPNTSREILAACPPEAVGRQDVLLPQELEKRIRQTVLRFDCSPHRRHPTNANDRHLSGDCRP